MGVAYTVEADGVDKTVAIELLTIGSDELGAVSFEHRPNHD
jgi:hypothetical protein